MWKLIFGSVQGTSHIQSGVPCQDYCSGAVSGSTLIAACADGAGSAELSQVGARAVVQRFMQIAIGDAKPTREQLEAWVESARESLLEEAILNGLTPRQLACTFLAALVGPCWAVFIQLGDGVIVFNGHDGYCLAFWPDIGEFANTTRFLSEDDYQAHLRIEIIDGTISELAILTDGLQMLALDFAGAKVHDRFFAPLFKTLKSSLDEAALKVSLLEFMGSKRVNERTDDDKSLLLATRISDDAPSYLSDATS